MSQLPLRSSCQTTMSPLIAGLRLRAVGGADRKDLAARAVVAVDVRGAAGEVGEDDVVAVDRLLLGRVAADRHLGWRGAGVVARDDGVGRAEIGPEDRPVADRRGNQVAAGAATSDSLWGRGRRSRWQRRRRGRPTRRRSGRRYAARSWRPTDTATGNSVTTAGPRGSRPRGAAAATGASTQATSGGERQPSAAGTRASPVFDGRPWSDLPQETIGSLLLHRQAATGE